jgi:hypothetical protein
MDIYAVLLSILAVVTVVFAPIFLIWSFVDYARGKGSTRRGGGTFTAGIGAAMQELDRIMNRPSIEHTIEAEHPTIKREDDTDGE